MDWDAKLARVAALKEDKNLPPQVCDLVREGLKKKVDAAFVDFARTPERSVDAGAIQIRQWLREYEIALSH